MRHPVKGFTLLEMLVVLLILGLVGAISGVMLARVPTRESLSEMESELTEARRMAIRDGRAVTIEVRGNRGTAVATFLPDGSGIVEGSARVDRLTGRSIRSGETAR